MGVRITVKEGSCSSGSQNPADVDFLVDNDRKTPPGMCSRAWGAVAPYVGDLLDAKEEEETPTHAQCPCPQGIRLELKRVDGEPE